MIEKLSNISKHKHFKSIILVTILVLLYSSYKIYVWANTESSDNAYLEANISNISAQVSGSIIQITAEENTLVKAGEIIAEIDPLEYQIKLNSTASELVIAEQNIKVIDNKILKSNIDLSKKKEALTLTEINLKVAERDYNRAYSLQKDNFTSKKLFDVAQVAFAKAKSEHNQASFDSQLNEYDLSLLKTERTIALEKLILAQQAKELAELNLKRTKIVAPISGILTNNSAIKKGNLVKAGAILCSIVPQDDIFVRVNFKETQVKKFQPKMKATIICDAFPKDKLEGYIRTISPATGAKFSLFPPDNATGNFTKIVQRIPVIIDIQDEKAKRLMLTPGMSASVSVRVD